MIWYYTLHSGVHATVAGVSAALAVLLQLDRGGDSLLLRMEHALFILPLFGLAQRLEGASWMHLWGMALLCGIGSR